MSVLNSTFCFLVTYPSILWGEDDIRRQFLSVEYKVLILYIDRSQKSLGLVNGAPDYTPVAGFADPDVPAKTQTYSVDGRLYAYALTNL